MLSTCVLEHVATCVYFFMRYYELCTPIFGFDFNMLFLCLFYVGINAPETKAKAMATPSQQDFQSTGSVTTSSVKIR